MPTIISHAAVPLALGIGLGSKTISKPLLAAGVFVSILPDLDGISFLMSIPYASILGHRGLSHSLFFAFCIALFGTLFSSLLRTKKVTCFLFLLTSMVSHSILDSVTTGGLGVAFLWPWSPQRFFLPFQVIRVSPLSLAQFLSPRGLAVLISELKWVWLPCLLTCLGFCATRVLARRMDKQDDSLPPLSLISLKIPQDK